MEKDAKSNEQHGDHELIIATRALQRNDLVAAEAAVRKHLLQHPGDARALELSADISSQRGQTTSAIELYQAAVDSSEPPSEALLDKLALQLTAAGRAFDALDVLQHRIERYPASVQARSDFVVLAAMLGIADRAVPSLQWLSQHGEGGDAETLQVLANPRRRGSGPRFLPSDVEAMSP